MSTIGTGKLSPRSGSAVFFAGAGLVVGVLGRGQATGGITTGRKFSTTAGPGFADDASLDAWSFPDVTDEQPTTAELANTMHIRNRQRGRIGIIARFLGR